MSRGWPKAPVCQDDEEPLMKQYYVRYMAVMGVSLLLLTGCGKDKTVTPAEPIGNDSAPQVVQPWGFTGLLDQLDEGTLPPAHEFGPTAMLEKANYHALGEPVEEGPLTFNTNDGVIEPDGLPGEDAWVKLTIGTSSHPSPDQRPPLDLSILVDGSGSMADGGAALAAYTVQCLEGQLHDGDRVALIVAAEGEAAVLRGVSPWNAIQDLEPLVEGYTFAGENAPTEGLTAAFDQFTDLADDPVRDRRVLWLTDDPFTRLGDVPSEAAALIQAGADNRIGFTVAALGAWPPEEVSRFLTATPGANSWWMKDRDGVYANIYGSFATVMSPVAWDVRIQVSEVQTFRNGLEFDHAFMPRAGELEAVGAGEFRIGSLYRSDTGFTGLFHLTVQDVTPEDSLVFFGDPVPLLRFDIRFLDREGQEHQRTIVDAFGNDEALFVPSVRDNESYFETPDVQRAVADVRQMWAMRAAVDAFQQGDANRAFNLLADLRIHLLEHRDVLYPDDYQTTDRMIADLETLMGF